MLKRRTALLLAAWRRMPASDRWVVGSLLGALALLLVLVGRATSPRPFNGPVVKLARITPLLEPAGGDVGVAGGVAVALRGGASQAWRDSGALICSAQPSRRIPPAHTLDKVLELPSRYVKGAPGFEVTVVISVFRRPQFLHRWLDAIRAQTHAATDIWVTTFSSPMEAQFRTIVEEHNAKNADKFAVKFVAGNVNFKYFGRMALGQMARTPYIQFFDDDSIPGARVIENSLHMINTDLYDGLIGMKGHGEVVDTPGTHATPPYYNDYEHRPARVKRVDLCGGMWFARTKWIHHMWAELPPELQGNPWETGEDFQMTYMLQKYAGLHTFLLPTLEDDASTWASSEDFFKVSEAGDSTNVPLMIARRNIHFENMMHGFVPARADTIWGEHHNVVNIAFLLPSLAAARQLAPAFRLLRHHLAEHVRLLPMIVTDPRSREAHARDDVLAALGMSWAVTDLVMGVWDAELHRLQPEQWSDVALFAQSNLFVDGALASARPALILSTLPDASVTAEASVAAARMAAIPLLLLQPQSSNCSASVTLLPGDADTTVCMPGSPHAALSSTGVFYTNSVHSLLSRALQTLCACGKADSVQGGGAFARCPPLAAQESLMQAFQ